MLPSDPAVGQLERYLDVVYDRDSTRVCATGGEFHYDPPTRADDADTFIVIALGLIELLCRAETHMIEHFGVRAIGEYEFESRGNGPTG